MDSLAFGALWKRMDFYLWLNFLLCIFRCDFLRQVFFSDRKVAANRFLFRRFSQDLPISFWKRHKFQSQPTRANVELPTAKSMRMNLDVDYRAQKNVTHNILVCWVYNIYICRFIIYIYIDRFRLGINLYSNLHIYIYATIFIQHVFSVQIAHPHRLPLNLQHLKLTAPKHVSRWHCHRRGEERLGWFGWSVAAYKAPVLARKSKYSPNHGHKPLLLVNEVQTRLYSSTSSANRYRTTSLPKRIRILHQGNPWFLFQLGGSSHLTLSLFPPGKQDVIKMCTKTRTHWKAHEFAITNQSILLQSFGLFFWWFFTDSTMGFITIFHQHMGNMCSFFQRREETNLR